MANIKFFWETLRQESFNKERSYDSPYINGFVTIHKIGDHTTNRYTIYNTGLVIYYGNNICKRMNIQDMTNDEGYELYSTVQVIKSGYLEFVECNNSDEVLDKLTELYYIVEEANNKGLPIWPYSSFWCGDKLCSPLFFSINGIDIYLHTIERFIEINSNRVKYGLKPLPYNSKIPKGKNWLKIKLVNNIEAAEEELSVKNQLDAIRFITDSIGCVFHDDYIRQWMW